MHRISLLLRLCSKWRTKQRLSHLPLLGTVIFTVLFTGLQFLPASFVTQKAHASAPTNTQPTLQKAVFTLDNVTVNIATPFLPGKFLTSKPGDSTQTATSGTPGLNVHPYGAIYITAVPFGTKPTTENVPVASTGGAPVYRDSLHQYRVREGDNPKLGPTVTLFGQHVVGEVSLMQGSIKQAFSSTVVVEWVVEAGKRLWIVRITQEQPLGTVDTRPASSLLASLNFLTITSSTLAHSTTIKITSVKANVTRNAVLSSYPFPAWWSSTCYDSDGSSPSGSYSMANWHGIDACGPVGTANSSSFGGRTSGGLELEWQCVELVQRYFIVAGYLTQTYSADGNQIVTAYPGSNLIKVNNQTSGQAPQVGDVLSYNTSDIHGHTALVIASNVDSSGSGPIQVLQQNSGYTDSSGNYVTTPTETLNDNSWNVTVSGWPATVTRWLHDPGTTPLELMDQAAQQLNLGSYTGQTFSGYTAVPTSNYRVYQNGMAMYNPNTNAAYAMTGTIYARWKQDTSMSFANSLGYLTSTQITSNSAWKNSFDAGTIYVPKSNGISYYVGGAIRDKYENLGGPEGTLGVPTADMQTITGGWKSTFQNGNIYCQNVGNPYYVSGIILSRYIALGETSGTAGFPTSDQQAASWGWKNSFQNGNIYALSSNGTTYYIGGYMRDKYESTGGPGGTLGNPTADQSGITNGWKSTFQNGNIYYQNNASAAYYVQGIILTRYVALGETSGTAGFPTSDQQAASWGWKNSFQHGNIYALSSNGTTYYIGGTIRDKYESLNGPDGILGVPTADMQTITGGWKSTFKNGTIYCQTSSPAYYVKGAILAKYQSLGETTSSLGFPTSDEQTLSWGWENTFQHGTISYNSSTGVTTVQYT